MTTSPQVLSLFSGVGGFDMGLEAAGMQTAALCEIDPKCRQVLRRHWPDVPIYEDVSTVTARQLLADGVEPDVIAFGSPCQDLSIAGRRAGLAGTRSGLFGEAVRIIRELRQETGGQYPRFAIWENVVGALSSTQGDDFAAVLDSLADAGAMVLEWAVLDAQHYGVPQRRRRIFLVACFDPATAERCPDPLLPVREGRPGDLAKGRKARKDAASNAATSTGNGSDGGDYVVTHDVAGTLNSAGNSGGFRTEPGEHLVVERRPGVMAIDATRIDDTRIYDDIVPTLKARMGTGGGQVPLVADDAPVIMRQREGKPGGGKGPLLSEDRSLTLGTSNDQYLFQPTDEAPCEVCGQAVSWCSCQRCMTCETLIPASVDMELDVDDEVICSTCTTGGPAYGFDSTFGAQSTVHTDQAPPLKVGSGLGIASPPAVGQPIPIHDQATRWSGMNGDKSVGKGNGLGIGKPGDPMNTLTGGDRHAVAQPVESEVYVKVVRPQSAEHPEVWRTEPVSPTLNAFDIGDGRTASIVVDPVEMNVVTPPLPTSDDPSNPAKSSDGTRQGGAVYETKMLVRRLTPVECERLMGWPDDHTRWTADGTEMADTSRYKMCGNGIASPVAEWVGKQIMGVWLA